jgi:Co/Zn/Cd efflux system component
MSASCCGCGGPETSGASDRRFQSILWVALAINLAMFGVEIGASFLAGSSALQADALDFLADSANYAISLSVAGLGLAWRARAAMIKGATMGIFGVGVLVGTVWHLINGTVPHADVMGMIGLTALVANGVIAAMLYRFRSGEANMRSIWLCSRNDAIGNLAVLAAAAGVFGTGTGWPDIAVALIMAGLGISGAWNIIRQASAELGVISAPPPRRYA